MKTKKMSKKLSLNKTTVAQLEKSRLREVAGGALPESYYYSECLCRVTWNCISEPPNCGPSEFITCDGVGGC